MELESAPQLERSSFCLPQFSTYNNSSKAKKREWKVEIGAQKGIFVILRNAVFLKDEKKSAPDLYRRNHRDGKRLRNGQFARL